MALIKFASYFFGFANVFLGILSLISEKKLFFRGFEIGPMTSIGFICLGVTFFWNAHSLKDKTLDDINYGTVYKCPNCGKVTDWYTTVEVQKCSKCNVEIEELKGFYERHPDFEDKE